MRQKPGAAHLSLFTTAEPTRPRVLDQAYITVVRVADGISASFNRNIRCASGYCLTADCLEVPGCPHPEVYTQLNDGRDTPLSRGGYWNVYHQMAFQGDPVSDADPRIEWPTAINGYQVPPLDERGSASLVENLWEQVDLQYGWRDPVQFARCSRNNIAHEIGHQLGLGHTGGLMQNCLANVPFFTAPQLGLIRNKQGF